MTNQELLIQFGNHVGIRNLKLDQQGSCQLKINDSRNIIINEVSETTLLICGIIGTLTDGQATAAALELLSMNLLLARVNGPYLCWQPQQKTLLICLRVDSGEMDAIALGENLSYLLQDVEQICHALKDKQIFVEEIV
ncbi:MAG TPA: CesT family type III secretion system chaperone [Buttiauxella sp.]|jgi:hypothetical protein